MVDEVIFMFKLTKPNQTRFIDIDLGAERFIDFHQTKESYYLATHQEKQNEDSLNHQDLLLSTPSEEENPSIDSSPKEKRHVIFFLMVLMLMGFVIWNLCSVFLTDTKAYLQTSGPMLFLEQNQSNSSESLTASLHQTGKLNESLGYFIYTQNGINNYYEESKTVINHFLKGRITQQEKVEKIQGLIKGLDQLAKYNQSLTKDNEFLSDFIQLNDERIETLKDALELIEATDYRSECVSLLNQAILEDQSIYERQVNIIKSFLTQSRLNYQEINGKLYFDFN